MLRSWRLGSLFQINLFVHSTFLIMPILLSMSLAIRGAGAFSIGFHLALLLSVFGCVLLHELGHALMAKRFGIKTRDITLYPIGGVARLEMMPNRPGEELWIALAGPAVNVVIALLLTPIVVSGFSMGIYRTIGFDPTYLQGMIPIALTFVFYLWMANIVLVLFNLLPTFPMDGGRVLRALLSMKFGLLQATTMAVMIGRTFILAGLIALAVFIPEVLIRNPMLMILGLFVFLAGQQELMGIRQRAAMEQPMRPTPPPQQEAPNSDFTGILWDAKSQLWILWRNGRPVGVVRL